MKNLNLINIFKYDTKKYPFREIIQKILECEELEKIHENFDFFLLERDKDQSTDFHKLFYSKYEKSGFKNLYEEFIKNYVSKQLETAVINQTKPTFRVHMHDNLGVGEFHRDSDYDHPLEEINFLVPVTEARDTSTVWIESLPDERDFSPVNLTYGECLVFRGGILTHGNKINKTGNSRVSFDFRVIPKALFKPSVGESINSGMKFDIGGYYSLLENQTK